MVVVAVAGCSASGTASSGEGGSGGISSPGSGGSSTGVAGTGEAGGASGPGIAGAAGTASPGGRGGTASSGVAGGSGTAGRGGSTGAAGRGGSGVAGTTGSPDGGSVSGCMAPTTYPNLFVTLSGHTQAESDAKVAAAWSNLFNPAGPGNIYFNGPGTDESYVKDIANSDVRTEGMSYGMMAAVQLGHQTEFDRLWKWVKTHMANGTGQIAWSCSPSGSKNSSGGAPDGEEYMATALIFAHNRWGDTSGAFNYATEAQWVLNLIRTVYFNANAHLVQFVAGSGNTDGSYILPAFYQAWACFDTANKPSGTPR